MREFSVAELQRKNDRGEIDEAISGTAPAFVLFEEIARRMICELRFGGLRCGSRCGSRRGRLRAGFG
jgi:hypothetical protein